MHRLKGFRKTQLDVEYFLDDLNSYSIIYCVVGNLLEVSLPFVVIESDFRFYCKLY